MTIKAYVYWIHLPSETNFILEGYVGVSRDHKRRFRDHNKSPNPYLRHNISNMICDVIIEGEEKYCYIIEGKLRPNRNIGGNIADGGRKPPSRKGKKHSPESIAKMKGKDYSERSKKVGRANLGKIITPEMRNNISEGMKASWVKRRL